MTRFLVVSPNFSFLKLCFLRRLALREQEMAKKSVNLISKKQVFNRDGLFFRIIEFELNQHYQIEILKGLLTKNKADSVKVKI